MAKVGVPLAQKAREISRLLGEPDWLLGVRLSAVSILESRRGAGRVSGLRMEGSVKRSFSSEGGAAVLSVAQAVARGNALKEQLAVRPNGMESDEYLLSLALFTEGTVVAVPAGKPCKVSIEMEGKPPDFFSTFFLLEDGCQASISMKTAFASRYGECRGIFAGRSSRARFCFVQADSAGCSSSLGMCAWLDEESRLALFGANLGGAGRKEGACLFQQKQGSRCEHYESSLAKGRQRIEKRLWHCHSAARTFSRAFLAYAAAGCSQVLFEGNVRIGQEAGGADAHLLAKSLLLSEKSSARLVPQLAVHNQDVAAGHGSAVAPICKEELFYLQSRGLGEKESRLALLEGFLSEPLRKGGVEASQMPWVASELKRQARRIFEGEGDGA